MGKTTTVAALSSSLAIASNKTLCLDFGKGENDLESTLCIKDSGDADHIDIRSRQDWTINNVTEHPEIPDLFVRSMPSFLEADKPDISEIKQMFAEIRHEFDYCVVDTPPVSYPGFNLALADADMAMIVTTGEIPTMVDVLRAARATRNAGCNCILLLANRVLPEDAEKKKAAIEKVTTVVGAQLIGLVPDSDIFSQAILSRMPLVRFTKDYLVYNYLCIAHIIKNIVPPVIEDDPPPPGADKQCITSQPDDHIRQPVVKGSDALVLEEPGVPAVEKCDVPVVEEPDGSVIKEPGVPVREESGSENVPFNIPVNLLGSYGDTKLWAQSTLKQAKIDDIIEIYAVMQSPFIAKEAVRNRMWLHDLLDDNGVPYYIEVDSRRGSKELVETQHIYVEKRNVGKAIYLIKKYTEADNIVRNNPDEDGDTVVSEDGIPQKKCPACGRDIDFDYQKCPHCKGQAG